MSILKTIHRVRAIREGGNVERTHTTPHHGSYGVDKHSWGVATLLAILHPNPSKELILAGLWHDVLERWTGDIPAPSKWRLGKVVMDEIKRLENSIESSLGINFDLSAEDLKWLKACDMLEFWLWSIDQGALGNCNTEEGKRNAEYWFNNHKDEVPDIVQDFMTHYNWHRTSDKDGWKLSYDI